MEPGKAYYMVIWWVFGGWTEPRFSELDQGPLSGAHQKTPLGWFLVFPIAKETCLQDGLAKLLPYHATEFWLLWPQLADLGRLKHNSAGFFLPGLPEASELVPAGPELGNEGLGHGRLGSKPGNRHPKPQPCLPDGPPRRALGHPAPWQISLGDGSARTRKWPCESIYKSLVHI